MTAHFLGREPLHSSSLRITATAIIHCCWRIIMSWEAVCPATHVEKLTSPPFATRTAPPMCACTLIDSGAQRNEQNHIHQANIVFKWGRDMMHAHPLWDTVQSASNPSGELCPNHWALLGLQTYRRVIDKSSASNNSRLLLCTKVDCPAPDGAVARETAANQGCSSYNRHGSTLIAAQRERTHC
jgi:hypothetical protein